jgi:hypothetical protein
MKPLFLLFISIPAFAQYYPVQRPIIEPRYDYPQKEIVTPLGYGGYQVRQGRETIRCYVNALGQKHCQ